MAQVAVIANEANEADGLTFAFGLRGPVMLMAGMLLMGITVLLRGLIVMLHGHRVIAVLPRRVGAERHGSREHSTTGEPQQHPSEHEEAKDFHHTIMTSVALNGSVCHTCGGL